MHLSNILLAALAVGSVAAQSTDQVVYYLPNQKYLEFGGVFELLDDNNKAVTSGFQLAESLYCAVQVLKDYNAFPDSILTANVADAPTVATDMTDVANKFSEKNVVAPVAAVSPAKLTQFATALLNYQAPVFAYMEQGALKTEYQTIVDLLFASPVTSQQARPLVSFAKRFAYTDVALVSTNDGAMQALFDGFDYFAGLTNAEGKAINTFCKMRDFQNTDDYTSLTVSTVTNYNSFINCMKSRRFKKIAIFATESEAPGLLARLYADGALFDDSTVLASSTWAKPSVIQAAVDAGVSAVSLQGTLAFFPFSGNKALLKKCLESRTAGITPYAEYPTNYAAAMKCTTSGNAAVCPANRDLTDPNISTTCRCRDDENLSAMTLDNDGINFVFDSVLASANAYALALTNCVTVARAINATQEELCGDSAKITGVHIAQITRNFGFEGLTGTVQFYNNYRSAPPMDGYQWNGTVFVKTAAFVTKNSPQTPANAQVVAYTASGNYRTVDPRSQQGLAIDTSVVTSRAADVDSTASFIAIEWDAPAAVAVAVLTAMGLAATLATAAFVVVYQNHPVIKRASPLFCALMLLGISLLYFELYLWIGRQTQSICVAKVWLPLLGFAALMGPMLAKTFRIWKIFDNSKLRARRLLTGHLLGMSAFVVGVNLVLLIIWTAADPLKVKSAQFLYGVCSGDNDSFQKGLFGTFVAYNGALLLLGSFLSYKTRSVVSSFNESQYIAYAMYNFTLCLAVLLPIYMTIKDGDQNSNIRTFVIRSVAVLFANTACLAILFGPKVYHVIKKTEDKGDLPTNGGNSNSNKKATKGATTGPTTNKNSTLVGNTTGAKSAADGSRPGATMEEKTNIKSNATQLTSTGGATSGIASTLNAGASVAGTESHGVTTTMSGN